MLPPDQAALARAHRQHQQQLAANAVKATAALWAGFNAANVLGWWAGRPTRLARKLLLAAQLHAARGAGRYVTKMLELQGADLDPAGEVPISAMVGTAADGRPLDSLLRQPAFEVDAFLKQGMPKDQALTIGRRHLKRIVATETADAARVATGVALVNERSASGYIRLLTPPSCSRCIILAGRWYRWSDGFQRHPQCDCVHVPAAEAPEVPSPKQVFDGMTETDQDRVLGKAGAQAIRDGADVTRVVNARRGMYTAGGRKLTRESTTRRGSSPGRIRLMPEQIYVEARGDRDEAIRLLRRFGYIR